MSVHRAVKLFYIVERPHPQRVLMRRTMLAERADVTISVAGLDADVVDVLERLSAALARHPTPPVFNTTDVELAQQYFEAP